MHLKNRLGVPNRRCTLTRANRNSQVPSTGKRVPESNTRQSDRPQKHVVGMAATDAGRTVTHARRKGSPCDSAKGTHSVRPQGTHSVRPQHSLEGVRRFARLASAGTVPLRSDSEPWETKRFSPSFPGLFISSTSVVSTRSLVTRYGSIFAAGRRSS